MRAVLGPGAVDAGRAVRSGCRTRAGQRSRAVGERRPLPCGLPRLRPEVHLAAVPRARRPGAVSRAHHGNSAPEAAAVARRGPGTPCRCPRELRAPRTPDLGSGRACRGFPIAADHTAPVSLSAHRPTAHRGGPRHPPARTRSSLGGAASFAGGADNRPPGDRAWAGRTVFGGRRTLAVFAAGSGSRVASGCGRGQGRARARRACVRGRASRRRTGPTGRRLARAGARLCG